MSSSTTWTATTRSPGGLETTRTVTAPDRAAAAAIATMHGDQLLYIMPVSPPPPPPVPEREPPRWPGSTHGATPLRVSRVDIALGVFLGMFLWGLLALVVTMIVLAALRDMH